MPLFFLFGAMSETMKRHERISGEPSRSQKLQCYVHGQREEKYRGFESKGIHRIDDSGDCRVDDIWGVIFSLRKGRRSEFLLQGSDPNAMSAC